MEKAVRPIRQKARQRSVEADAENDLYQQAVETLRQRIFNDFKIVVDAGILHDLPKDLLLPALAIAHVSATLELLFATANQAGHGRDQIMKAFARTWVPQGERLARHALDIKMKRKGN